VNQALRHSQPFGDRDRVALSRLSQHKPIGRPQRFNIEFDTSVFDPLALQRIALQRPQMCGRDAARLQAQQLVEYCAPDRGAFVRVGPCSKLIQ